VFKYHSQFIIGLPVLEVNGGRLEVRGQYVAGWGTTIVESDGHTIAFPDKTFSMKLGEIDPKLRHLFGDGTFVSSVRLHSIRSVPGGLRVHGRDLTVADEEMSLVLRALGAPTGFALKVRRKDEELFHRIVHFCVNNTRDDRHIILLLSNTAVVGIVKGDPLGAMATLEELRVALLEFLGSEAEVIRASVGPPVMLKILLEGRESRPSVPCLTLEAGEDYARVVPCTYVPDRDVLVFGKATDWGKMPKAVLTRGTLNELVIDAGLEAAYLAAIHNRSAGVFLHDPIGLMKGCGLSEREVKKALEFVDPEDSGNLFHLTVGVSMSLQHSGIGYGHMGIAGRFLSRGLDIHEDALFCIEGIVSV